jgi:hypothetical protein
MLFLVIVVFTCPSLSSTASAMKPFVSSSNTARTRPAMYSRKKYIHGRQAANCFVSGG